LPHRAHDRPRGPHLPASDPRYAPERRPVGAALDDRFVRSQRRLVRRRLQLLGFRDLAQLLGVDAAAIHPPLAAAARTGRPMLAMLRILRTRARALVADLVAAD